MTRMAQTTSRDLVRFLKKNGFQDDRQKGSHLTLWNPLKKIAVTVPIHSGCDIGRGLCLRILKDAGHTIDDYLSSR